MQLAELIKDWPCQVKGSIREWVDHISESSQDVLAQTMFFAHRGEKTSGTRFALQAIERGANIIVTDDELFFDTWKESTTIVWVPNSRQFCAFVSHRFFGEPSHVLPIIAITGTNGKTTVSHFIGQLATAMGIKTLVIGTNGIYLDGERQKADEQLTTKSAIFLQRLLKKAIQQNVELVVLEASSMGLEQHRLDFCMIDVGVYLNLTEEHLDNHGTMEKYKAAKRRLVPLSEQIVCNADDAFCRLVAMKCTKPVMLFSKAGQGDLNMQILHEDLHHSLVKLSLGDYEEICTLHIAGSYMHENAAAAISTLTLLGVDLADIVEHLPVLTYPQGRMQKIILEKGVQVYIDYAHTPAALKAVLKHLERNCKGNLIVVFSCGGDRDRQKRQEMGRIASKYADIILLTTDNCRSENPATINEEIRSGFFAAQEYEELLDRKEAILRAIDLAKENDIVLVAGKGHENTQVIGDKVYPFSDYEVIMSYFNLHS